MVRSKITYYTMLTPERRYEIQREIRATQAARPARIAVGLPPDSPEPEKEEEQPVEEEEQPGEEEEEMAPMKVEDPDQQVPAFNIEQAKAEFVVVQSDEMAEQQDIMESIQGEAYVEANRAFIRREQAESDTLFAELDAEIEAEEAGAEQLEAQEEPELQLLPMMPDSGTEIVVISDEK